MSSYLRNRHSYKIYPRQTLRRLNNSFQLLPALSHEKTKATIVFLVQALQYKSAIEITIQAPQLIPTLLSKRYTASSVHTLYVQYVCTVHTVCLPPFTIRCTSGREEMQLGDTNTRESAVELVFHGPVSPQSKAHLSSLGRHASSYPTDTSPVPDWDV